MAHLPYLNVTGAQVQQVMQSVDLAVIPFGSAEYHGPHAPLGTDSFIAAELAGRVAGRLNAVLCPLIAYTTCPVSTRHNPGTISIDDGVMVAYIADVFSGLLRHGLQGLLALNAHDGNIDTVKRAAERMVEAYPDRFILLINWWQVLPTSLVESLDLFSQGGGHGHGGPLETSAAWAVAPGAVDLSKGKDIDPVSDAPDMLTVLHAGRARPAWAGYHGRVSESSIEKGATLLNLAEERIAGLVQDWIRKGSKE